MWPGGGAPSQQRVALYLVCWLLSDLNDRLEVHPGVAGGSISAADIDAAVTLDFAQRATKMAPDDHLTALKAWSARVNAEMSGSDG